jgi:class 3 adenylate cyclase
VVPDTETLAIVFADIAGSTRLYDTLGDTTARQLVAECLEAMTRVVRRHGGAVIKTIGDEVLCTFATAAAGVEAAIGMQEAITYEVPGSNPHCPADLAVRIGLHYGPALLEGGDVFGDAVNVAARMAGLAKGGQIITTQATAGALPALLQASTRQVDRLTVKGKADAIDIYEVVWQAEEVTRMSDGVLASENSGARLHLRCQDQHLIVGPLTGPCVLGRGKKANLVVNDGLVSREHARIELRRGKFVLSDHSTNGTYVLTPEGPFYLRRDEMMLSGEGRIGLGRDVKEDSPQLVHYRCES